MEKRKHAAFPLRRKKQSSSDSQRDSLDFGGQAQKKKRPIFVPPIKKQRMKSSRSRVIHQGINLHNARFHTAD